MFKKQNNMTVMDFTGIYENEKFYKHIVVKKQEEQ